MSDRKLNARATSGPPPDWITETVRQLPPILTTAEVVALLRVSTRHFYRLMADGRILAVKTSSTGAGKLLFPRSGIETYLRSIHTPGPELRGERLPDQRGRVEVLEGLMRETITLWHEWSTTDITADDDRWVAFTDRVHAWLERARIAVPERTQKPAPKAPPPHKRPL